MVGKEDDKAQRVIAIVDEMRKNSQDMRQWKNIPLANECVQLLKEIDATEEPPIGKALACGAVISQLPEYDVPRLVLSILSISWNWCVSRMSRIRNAIPQKKRCRPTSSA